MRLLSTRPSDASLRYATLELHDFQVLPTDQPFAILSHTWGRLVDEILFAELSRICDQDVLQDDGVIAVDITSGPGQRLTRKPGWHKLRSSLSQAWQDGFAWLWADTACIDKSSSAELTEAINSMWDWYDGSSVCYVYLEDVSFEQSAALLDQNCLNSRWATRGWTLQELLAPSRVHFFSSEWIHLGDKHELADALHATTKIDVAVLKGEQSVETASIAKRMSWAAYRQTTRPEDRAYSLMGLFGVNMPMLYGEGKKAFLRLQEEIMRGSNDHSLFAWKSSSDTEITLHGLLADSPEDFRDSWQYRTYSFISEPISLTNRGLSISMQMFPARDNEWLARLQCPHPERLEGHLVIRLKKLHTGDRDFGRIRCNTIDYTSESGSGEMKAIFVPQKFALNLHGDAIMPRHMLRVSVSTRLPLGPDDNRTISASATESVKLLNTWNTPFSSTLKIGNRAIKSPQLPLSLVQVKQANVLSNVLVFDARASKEKMVVMLGTDDKGDLAWDCVQRPSSDSLASLKTVFNAQPIGSTVEVPEYDVSIAGTSHLRSGVKVFMLELTFSKLALVSDLQRAKTWQTKESDESASSGGSGVKKLKNILSLRKTD